jgi:hypothetical protein
MNRLRPLTFFPPVVPFRPAAVGRLDRLAVDPQCFGHRRGPGLDTNFFPKRGVNLLPNPGLAPVAEQAVDGLPRREVVGDHPPRSARPQVVEDGVDDLPPINGDRMSALACAGLGLGQQWVEALPLLVGQVGRVRLPAHKRRH